MPKLDLNSAWTRALNMLAKNRELAVVISGLFHFLPLAALFLVLLGSEIQLPKEGDEESFALAIEAFISRYWWLLLLVGLLQLVGAIAIIRILGDPEKPTVGEAIRGGLKMLLPLLGAQLLAGIAIQAIPLIGDLSGVAAITALATLIGFPLAIYLSLKFLLISPVVALENRKNPIEVLKRSWALTKGSSLRLFAFFVLLLLAFIVLFFVIMMLAGLILAFFGEQVVLVGMALFYAAMLTVGYVVGYAVITAIYRQLSSEPVSGAGVPKSGTETRRSA